MGLRRRSRELAMQVLFQGEFEKDLNVEQGLALYRESFDSEPEIWDFSKNLIRGVFLHKEAIDQKIQSHSSHWKLDRMSIVDRNVLRIAVFEMMYLASEVPRNVVINEAIEVAKKFGATDSSGFVNGILDQLSKSLGEQ
ncbi:MAG: transcription antitermination factor NusB [Bdellovibrionales bacterium]|nr:transcription antitermination factor NusB [Bdellovibrionales bacterium]